MNRFYFDRFRFVFFAFILLGLPSICIHDLIIFVHFINLSYHLFRQCFPCILSLPSFRGSSPTCVRPLYMPMDFLHLLCYSFFFFSNFYPSLCPHFNQCLFFSSILQFTNPDSSLLTKHPSQLHVRGINLFHSHIMPSLPFVTLPSHPE